VALKIMEMENQFTGNIIIEQSSHQFGKRGGLNGEQSSIHITTK
jgi:hypothetical protein